MPIDTTIQGIPLLFKTAPSLFSPNGVDPGTLCLLARVRFANNDKVLDLGCGYGAMGIYAAKLLGAEQVHMTDNDPIAIRCAEHNAQVNGVASVHAQLSDGFRDLRVAGFTKILCNPPYHTDFSVAKHFIEKGFNRLLVGGAMWLVTKRDKWYRNKLSAVFGGARVAQCDSYFVFEAIKKNLTYSSVAPKQSASSSGPERLDQAQKLSRHCGRTISTAEYPGETAGEMPWEVVYEKSSCTNVAGADPGDGYRVGGDELNECRHKGGRCDPYRTHLPPMRRRQHLAESLLERSA
jgi:16S rRNA (guanine1207-N2)-methyltransferase